jgi:octaprenyl-diphosphate synthase
MGIKTSQVFLSGKDIFELVKGDLERVEEDLKDFASSSLPLINNVNKYLHESGGKRLRPIVLLLASKLGNPNKESAVRLAGVVELIHVATLVHDDIIDNSDIRRGRPSVNATWGNQITVLIGDWMYMTAFYLALELQNFKVLDILIDVTRTMVEGELIQLERNGALGVSPEQYVEISSRKTACLFSACTHLGAIVGGLQDEQAQKVSEYGRLLGLAFQFIDDLLDYTSDELVLGKPVLKDLEEGKVTLPIISLLQKGDADTRAFIERVVQEKQFTAENKRRIIELVESYNTLDDLRAIASEHVLSARACLDDLPDSIYLDALRQIPDLIIHRTS